MALVPKPHEISLLPRFTLDSGKVLQCYSTVYIFVIIPFYVNLEHRLPRFDYEHVDILLY